MIKSSILIIMMMSMIFSIISIIQPPQSTAYAESDSKKDENKYEKHKEICSNYGEGEWRDGECRITDIEERGAYEDYVCDHPPPGIPYEEVCN